MGFRFHVGPVSWGPSKKKNKQSNELGFGGVLGGLLVLICLVSMAFPIVGVLVITWLIYEFDSEKRKKYIPYIVGGYFITGLIWAYALWRVGFDKGHDAILGTSIESDFMGLLLEGGWYMGSWIIIASICSAVVYWIVIGVKKLWDAI